MKRSRMIGGIIAACALLSSWTAAEAQTTTQEKKTSAGLLGNIIGALTNGQTIGNTVKSILGTDKPKEKDIIGTWKYSQPGVSFTTQKTLAKAGGEAMATDIKNKLAGTYSKIGFTDKNTYYTFTSDKKFKGKIDGKNITGTWTYTADDQKIVIKTLLLSITLYAKNTTEGMSFLMESKKFLTTLQALTAFSGNTTLKNIGELSKNYDGIRIGFDMKK